MTRFLFYIATEILKNYAKKTSYTSGPYDSILCSGSQNWFSFLYFHICCIIFVYESDVQGKNPIKYLLSGSMGKEFYPGLVWHVNHDRVATIPLSQMFASSILFYNFFFFIKTHFGQVYKNAHTHTHKNITLYITSKLDATTQSWMSSRFGSQAILLQTVLHFLHLWSGMNIFLAWQ